MVGAEMCRHGDQLRKKPVATGLATGRPSSAARQAEAAALERATGESKSNVFGEILGEGRFLSWGDQLRASRGEESNADQSRWWSSENCWHGPHPSSRLFS